MSWKCQVEHVNDWSLSRYLEEMGKKRLHDCLFWCSVIEGGNYLTADYEIWCLFGCVTLISSAHFGSIRRWEEKTSAMYGIYTTRHTSLKALFSLNIWVTTRSEASIYWARLVMHLIAVDPPRPICSALSPTCCNPTLCATGSAGCHCDPLPIVSVA